MVMVRTEKSRPKTSQSECSTKVTSQAKERTGKINNFLMGRCCYFSNNQLNGKSDTEVTRVVKQPRRDITKALLTMYLHPSFFDGHKCHNKQCYHTKVLKAGVCVCLHIINHDKNN